MSELDDLAATPTPTGARKFGTFEGVFTPTTLTILGVIMYLREGWVVGNAGLAGAWAIIGLASAITLATALSLSSVTTNIRIGAGGAYSVISRSLGLEAGGAIGIPLYLSQALVVALYVFGFREGWQWIFPGHPALAIDLIAFACIFGIAYISASFAFRMQYVIMAVIVGSLGSIVIAAFQGSMSEPIVWVGDFPDSGGFWIVFAVFFPAVTGIMAGANMSGELADPKRAIPLGTLTAIGLCTVVYMALAYWLARSATTQELVSNFTIVIDRAAWGPIVVAGLLGATFSSALASIVGAPRILQALAVNQILPGSDRLAELTPKGEPRNAMLVTGAIALGGLMLRDLNAIAPLVSMFFLLTYAMINVVVLMEQSLGQLSFRPTLRTPRFVAIFGTVGCFFAMFIINAVFSLIAAIIVVAVYAYLLRRRLVAPHGDSRSGVFLALAEWAAKKVSVLPDSSDRAWKPNLLVPVEDPGELRGTYRLIHSMTYPRGGAKLLGLTTGNEEAQLRQRLPIQVKNLQRAGVFASSSVVAADDFDQGLSASMQALSSAFFKPNLIFLSHTDDPERSASLKRLIPQAHSMGLGVLIFGDHPKAGLGLESVINIWIAPGTMDWEDPDRDANVDLALLIGFVLARNWSASIRLICVVETDDQRETERKKLRELTELARIKAELIVVTGHYKPEVAEHQADLNIVGLSATFELDAVGETMRSGRSSAIFVSACGAENAFA